MKDILTKKFFLITTFSIIALNGSAQVIDIDARNPRRKENSNATGHYELVVLIDKAKINQGDSILVEMYITGYGEIKQPKIFVSSSSSNILDQSYVKHSFDLSGGVKDLRTGYTNYKDWNWGTKRMDFSDLPMFIQWNTGISATINDTVYNSGSFVDVYPELSGDTYILTEKPKSNAPLSMHLYFKKDARPDDYKLNLYFTYFNGSEWTGSVTTLDFRINNWLQKNETPLQITAIVIALISILPLLWSGLKLIGIVKFGKFIWNIIKKLFQKKSKPKVIKATK